MRTAFLLPILLLVLTCQTGLFCAEKAEDAVPCPACTGTGTCSSCHQGKAACPRTCIKKEGKWINMKFDGHPDDELYQGFKGKKVTQYVTKAHIGELIDFDADGEPFVNGKCPTCNGTTEVTCPSCAGTGVCSTCSGVKTVTKAEAKKWSAKAKDEATAKKILEQLMDAEKKAGSNKGALAEVARNYHKLAQKYPSTEAGQRAKAEAERLAKTLH